MANQDVQTKLMRCDVKQDEPSVTVKATLSAPDAGGWAVFLDGTFVQGGNAPADVDLGTGAAVIGKMVEVSAVMKNITGTTQTMTLTVDTLGASDGIAGNIDPGHSAHDSMLVVYEEAK